MLFLWYHYNSYTAAVTKVSMYREIPKLQSSGKNIYSIFITHFQNTANATVSILYKNSLAYGHSISYLIFTDWNYDKNLNLGIYLNTGHPLCTK